MGLGLKSTVRLLALSWVATATAIPAQSINPGDFAKSNIIQRDVVVVGGGSSGTYAAIRLRDANQSVVVVEQKGRLGGHTETYHDPVTGRTEDIGVIVFHNLQIVRDYFGRFNIPLIVGGAGGGGVNEYVDFTTGKVVPNYIPANFTTAFGIYGQQVAKYPYLEDGFDLPYPVPADLLLPFGDFIKKYSIQDAANFIAGFAQGIGDPLAIPTIYIFKYIGIGVLQDIQTGFLTTAREDNSQLYEAATTFLGQDVLFNSTVIATDRSAKNSVKLVVKTPTGPKLILAKRLVLAIEPVPTNLAPFDLSTSERNLFGQFQSHGYYTSAVRNLGTPDNVTINDIGANTLYNIPKLPAIYGVSATGIPNLHNVMYGSNTVISSAQAQSAILADLNKLVATGVASPSAKPEFAIFSNHSPFELTVPAKAIAGGFYKRLYALQGQRNTYYTGAAWHTHDSTELWIFTEKLIPRIVAS